MKWMLFFQTPYDTIKYITDELEDYTSLTYTKFMEHVYANINVKDSLNFRDEVDKFKTIFLDCETGDWSVKKRETNPADINFKNILKLNPELNQVEEVNKKSELETLIEARKATMEPYYDKRRKDNDYLNRYK